MKERTPLTEDAWGGMLAEEAAKGHLWILNVDRTHFRPMWEGEEEGGCAQENCHSGVARRRRVNVPLHSKFTVIYKQ